MSLPAGQERTLHHIEGALQATEPQLASMFAIFTRLNRDEPVGAEPVQRQRPRWLPSKAALSAVVLIPVMFAAVIIGALLSGSARGATSCQVSYPPGGEAALLHRANCPRTQTATPAPASSAPASSAPASSAPASSAPASSAPAAAAAAQAPSGAPQGPCPPVGPAAFTADQQGFPPPARAGTLTARPSGMC
jgi:hypothetical protein